MRPSGDFERFTQNTKEDIDTAYGEMKMWLLDENGKPTGVGEVLNAIASTMFFIFVVLCGMVMLTVYMAAMSLVMLIYIPVLLYQNTKEDRAARLEKN